MSMEIRTTRTPMFAGDGVDIRILDNDAQAFARAITLETVTDATRYMEIPVAAHLGMNEAQMLMDSLWDCGLRPTDGTGSAGSLRATENHLSDMKAIAFHALKMRTDR